MTPKTLSLKFSVVLTQAKVYGVCFDRGKDRCSEEQLPSARGSPSPNVIQDISPLMKLLQTNSTMGCVYVETNTILNTMTLEQMQ